MASRACSSRSLARTLDLWDLTVESLEWYEIRKGCQASDLEPTFFQCLLSWLRALIVREPEVGLLKASWRAEWG